MASDPLPNGDALFLNWAANFAKVALTNADALHLDAEATDALSAAASDFAAAYSASQAAKNTLRGRIATKKAQRKVSEANFRLYAKMILADPTISVALKGSLGLTPGVRRSQPVTEPTTVGATGYSNGSNFITWNRNGNSRATIFILEAKVGNGPYEVIDVSTRTRFHHRGQVPGQQISYRVRAKRGKAISGVSNTAIVYADVAPRETLRVA